MDGGCRSGRVLGHNKNIAAAGSVGVHCPFCLITNPFYTPVGSHSSHLSCSQVVVEAKDPRAHAPVPSRPRKGGAEVGAGGAEVSSQQAMLLRASLDKLDERLFLLKGRVVGKFL